MLLYRSVVETDAVFGLHPNSREVFVLMYRVVLSQEHERFPYLIQTSSAALI